jgi:hypothetical protein
MGDGRILPQNLRASLFNDNLLNVTLFRSDPSRWTFSGAVKDVTFLRVSSRAARGRLR